MIRPSAAERELAALYSRYVRTVDGVERQQLGARLDVLAAQVLNPSHTHQRQERSDGISKSDEDSGEAAVHV